MIDGNFTVKQLLTEYDLDIDDIRWYKSSEIAQQLLSYSEEPGELISYIWSGNLSDDLYDMEDRYLETLQEQVDRGLIDETGIREILADAYALKNKRNWNN